MNEDIKKRVKDAVDGFFPKAVDLSCALAAEPELSGVEFKSAARIKAILGEAGFKIEAPFCDMPTAFKAVFENGSGPKVALLAEYDALPGVGHGCGHNLSGALSVLAASALVKLAPLFKGTLIVFGTPDEEVGGGKIGMAAKGAFDGLDLAMMMHSNAISTQPNMDALSLRNYKVSFKGQSAHAAAAPWQGKSALAAARKFLDLVDARRECFTPDIRVNAIFTSGGKAVNIIPDYAELCFEFRTESVAKLNALDAALKKCARGAAIALDCEEEFTLSYPDYADMVRLPSLEAEAAKLFAEEGIASEPVSPPIGSTDVGNVSYRCPALQPLISITDKNIALHTADFAEATGKPEAERALAAGARVLSALAIKVFNDEDFRALLQREFKERRELKLGQR